MPERIQNELPAELFERLNDDLRPPRDQTRPPRQPNQGRMSNGHPCQRPGNTTTSTFVRCCKNSTDVSKTHHTGTTCRMYQSTRHCRKSACASRAEWTVVPTLIYYLAMKAQKSRLDIQDAVGAYHLNQIVLERYRLMSDQLHGSQRLARLCQKNCPGERQGVSPPSPRAFRGMDSPQRSRREQRKIAERGQGTV